MKTKYMCHKCKRYYSEDKINSIQKWAKETDSVFKMIYRLIKSLMFDNVIIYCDYCVKKHNHKKGSFSEVKK